MRYFGLNSSTAGYVFCVLCPAVLSSGLAAAQTVPPANQPGLTNVFTFTNFSDVSALTINGDARQHGAILVMSPELFDQLGSVWYTNQVNVAQGFVTTFNIRIQPANSCCSADGMAFVIQNSSVTAIGTSTGQPGYDGIANSIAVEFDTFYNPQISDPNNNHMGIQSCGTAPNSFDHGSSCNLGLQPNLPVTLADGMRHQVTIRYIPGRAEMPGLFTASIDDQVVLTSSLNLATLLALNGNDAWVGFTGGTGSVTEIAQLLTWSFSSVGTAAPVTSR